MNPNTPTPSDDDLPDERELAALYARLPKDEPGPALDTAILSRAATAMPARRRARWPVALASAAMLVLAVGVAWQVRDTKPEPKAVPPAIVERMPAKPVARSAAKKAMADRVVPQAVRSAPAPITAPMARAPAEPLAPPSPAAPPPPVPAPPVAAQATEAFSEAAPAALAPRRQDLAPDDRVGEIRRLLDRGQREEALHRLHQLRARYPHYDIPQDLRDLEP